MMDVNRNERSNVFVDVEEIIISSKSSEECEKVAKMYGEALVLSAMDDAHFFLGMKIERDRECIKIW